MLWGFYYRFGVADCPAPLVALMMNIEPLTTLLAARLIVGENLSLLQYSGMLMAVLGICIGSSTFGVKATGHKFTAAMDIR